MSILRKLKNAFETLKQKRSLPLRIEFVVTDHCNLNCKGCTHYSPLVPAEYQPLEQMQRAMQCISQSKNSQIIADIYLIGGETLLYPQLIEAMHLARKYFPTNKLSIFTNGIALPKMSREFWQVCRDTNTEIAITRYPIKFDYDGAEQLCRDNGVALSVFSDRSAQNTFFRFALDRTKSQNKWLAHFRCYNFGCVSVTGDKIFPCSISACADHLNKAFDCGLQWESSDYIDIDSLTDARQIMRLRNRPVPFCAYCKKPTVTTYGPSRRDAAEWLD